MSSHHVALPLVVAVMAFAAPHHAFAAPLPSRPELDVALVAPKVARYVPSAAGPEAERVRLRVTNTSARQVNVASLRVSFSATRNGVPFPCKHHDGGTMNDPEPRALQPGATFTFERDIDCALAALGTYEVVVRVGFGRADYDHGDEIGSFALDVVGSGPSVPRPHPALPALHIALTGETTAHPLTPETWLRGDYKVMAVIVNTAPSPITTGPMQAVLRVSSKNATVPCPSERLTTTIPGYTTFEPGRPRTFALPLRCPLKPGQEYDVAVMLALAEGASAPEAGRLHVKVQRDEDVPLPEDRPPSR